MNNFIKQVIEEKFVSKAQQRYFFAQAKKGGKKGKKWAKWAKEFSDDTDYKTIPDKVEEIEIDEIVDDKGNIKRRKKPSDWGKKVLSQKKTSDEVEKAVGNSMGNYGTTGVQNYKRYWGEISEVELGDTLGADETILKDKSFKEAFRYFTKELGLTREKALDKMADLGYHEDLPDDKIIVVENPKKYIEEYIDELLKDKTKHNDILSNEKEIEEEDLNPIIKKQIKSLKNTLKSNNITVDQIIKSLKNDE